MERLGLEKWEDSDLRIKGSDPRKSLEAEAREEKFWASPGGRWRVQRGGRWSGCQKTEGGAGDMTPGLTASDP